MQLPRSIEEIAPERAEEPRQGQRLAEAADVLSDQLREHLQRLAALLEPQADPLDQRFLAGLRSLRFDARQRAALAQVTPGAAARILAHGFPPGRFFEQVEYNGRRLAKLNLPPSDIVRALEEYDRLLTPTLKRLLPEGYANLDWVREQLHFCVILTLNNAYYQVREAETEAFYELFRVELESRNLDELLDRFLRTLARFCRADAGHLFLLADDGSAWIRKAAIGPSSTARVPNTTARRKALRRSLHIRPDADSQAVLLDGEWRQGLASCWSIPLSAGGRMAGVMQFGFSKPYDWLPREQELLAAAAERCLMAAEKARLMEDLAAREEQVRQLAEHILHVEEIERRRISRELHDEAGQSLLCVRLQLEMLEHGCPDHPGEWKSRLREARDLTERTILEIRRLIAALSPAVLQQLGLGAALRQLVSRFRQLHPIRVRLHLGKLGRLPQETEMIVYRLVQECFNNIAKHSSATHVNLSLISADGVLRFDIEDDGVGFDVDQAFRRRDSFGLAGMRERVTLLGGNLHVESRQAAPASSGGLAESAGGQGRSGRASPRNLAGAGGRREPGTRISIALPIPGEGDRHEGGLTMLSQAAHQEQQR